MKVPKKSNPFCIIEGQSWKRKRKDRPNKFIIKEFIKDGDCYFAVVEYNKGKKTYSRKINLSNFSEYKRV